VHERHLFRPGLGAFAAGTCTSGAGLVSARRRDLQYNATAPGVSAAAPAGAGGAVQPPVAVAFTGSDAASGIDSCTSGTYSGGQRLGVRLGKRRDKAGNTGGGSFALRYDSTPPSITGGTPDRAGRERLVQYSLLVTFAGTDAASGIAACDAPPRQAEPRPPL
jgi:hypothetical protein